MVEVEKKIILNNKDRKRLIKGAKFLSKQVFTDIYYDTDNFSLTSNDKWLRSRRGRFELKIPSHQGTERLADQYDELENEQKIRKVLNLQSNRSFSDDLTKNKYMPFCVCKTTRRKYKKGPFIIDLDIVDFQDFTYNIGEIELLVNKKSGIENAIDKIMFFIKEQKLTISPVRGKVIEYLKQTKPNHYRALIRTGVVKDF